MPSDSEIEARFWKDLKAAPIVMLGLDGARDGHTQPMTAQFEEDHGPIWFFSSKDNTLTGALAGGSRAIASYTAKGHDLFATIHGTLSDDTDPATIDRLWNKEVEAWYKGGKTDPKLVLLRLDTDKAQIWLNSSSIGAAITRLFGKDPQASAMDKVAKVALT